MAALQMILIISEEKAGKAKNKKSFYLLLYCVETVCWSRLFLSLWIVSAIHTKPVPMIIAE
jgi:hypothetical protein